MSACDSHFHVFGPEERYPYSTELRYRPPHAPLEAYLAHARADPAVPRSRVAVLDRAPRDVSRDAGAAAARLRRVPRFRARVRALLGEAHWRVSHLHRAGLRRHRAARTRADRLRARAGHLGLGLPAPLVRRQGRLEAALRAAWRMGAQPCGARENPLGKPTPPLWFLTSFWERILQHS